MPQPWSARNTQGGPEILTTAQMYAADKAAMTAGVSGPTLMDHAGWAVTRHAVDMLRRIRAEDARRRLTGPVVILCGPGNNGGDGFVVARLLARRGIAVRVYLLGASEALTGDAAVMAQRWSGPVHKISALAEGDAARLLRHVPLVVDALFGAGLSRALDPGVLSLFAQISQALCPVLAIDMPSGVQGNTGDVLGGALQAQKTVTFFRLKPGHLIEPGAALCGQ
ncbi:MAG: NAD(P)H-hydrate epimerase, partial [Rhodospirillaceae bacterium]